MSFDCPEYTLVGQLVELVLNKRDKLKYIKVLSEGKQHLVKISKKIPNLDLQPGVWLEMRVVQQHAHQEDKVNVKADRLKIVKSETKETLDKIPNQERSKILVCNKPNCWKRGGKAVCELLKESLRDRGWEEKVEIRETGCFKECKNAPVIVMLPNKARYKQVQPQQIPSLIEKHLAV